jgi:hypothetical protein
MATEDIRIDGSHLTVDRPVEHKGNVDVDLAEVEQVYVERSPDPAADGALVLTTGDGIAHLIRVSNDDIEDVMAKVYDAWPKGPDLSQPDLLSEISETNGEPQTRNIASAPRESDSTPLPKEEAPTK